MMKRILSMLLALLMLASVFPASAFAEDTTATTAATTEATTAPACPTCGAYDCTSDHANWCDICKADNCGKEHKPCETCGTVDCTKEHKTCPTCGTVDCAKEHKTCDKCSAVDCTTDHTNWCDLCKADNCGKEHKACETCGTVDCTKEHKTCPTCSAVDCTADHTNWCDKCKKDNCGVEHNVLKKLLGSKSAPKTAEPCAYCEATPNDDGVIEHTAQCNTKFSVNASADVGQTAIFTGWRDCAPYANSKPDERFDYDQSDDGSYDFRQAKYDIDNPPLVKIVDAHWEVSGPALWYRVEALDGETLPEGITSDSWILQRYTNMQDPDNTLFFVDTSLLGKTVGFKNATVALYSDIYGDDSKEVTQEALPVMVVEDIFHDGEKAWYSVNSENWPEEYADYHYVPASAVELVEASEEPEWDETTPVDLVLSATVDGVTITFEGRMPIRTTLSASAYEIGDPSDFGLENTDNVKAAYDIKLLDGDGNETQPEDAVFLAMDASEMGLEDADVVEIIHKHGSEVTKSTHVVIKGMLVFPVEDFSIFVVNHTTETTGVQITGNTPENPYVITVGETKIFFDSYGGGISPYVPTDYTVSQIYQYGYKHYYLENGEYRQVTITRSNYYPRVYTIRLDGNPIEGLDELNGNTVPYGIYRENNYTTTYIGEWQVADESNAITYTIEGAQANGYQYRAPYITVVAKDTGNVTLTYKFAHQQIIHQETLYLRVVAPDTDLYIDDQVPENGRLVPAGLDPLKAYRATYTWSRSDGRPIHEHALNTDGSINLSIDRGGLTEKLTSLTYTLTVKLLDGQTLEAAYDVPYTNEILNSSFETPVLGLSETNGGHKYYMNGYPGLYWKTTAPGNTPGQLTEDIEVIQEGSSSKNDYGVRYAAHGKQFVELNAEAFGTLYQDILTTPGANLSWSFSHTKRANSGRNDTMYIIVAATKFAQHIVDAEDIRNLLSAAKQQAQQQSKEIPLNQNADTEGFEFTYSGGTYRVWKSIATSAAQSENDWKKLSGVYQVPEGQYLTRLFFASETDGGDSTLGNLIDAVSAGEYMDYTVRYYTYQKNQYQVVETATLSGTDRVYEKISLNKDEQGEDLEHFLDQYGLPSEILINGKTYPGTVEDLQQGLYITDYGTKINDAAADTFNDYDIVLQIYFQVPVITVTKEIVITNWADLTVQEKKALIGQGLTAEFGLYTQENPTATDTPVTSTTVTIIQESSSGKLTAMASFPIDENYYGNDYWIREISAPNIPNYVMVTTYEKTKVGVKLDDGNPDNGKETVDSVKVTNTYSPRGKLELTKHVTKAFADDLNPTLTQMTQSFTFKLQVNEPKAGTKYRFTKYVQPENATLQDMLTTFTDTQNGELSLTNGECTFTLKHGERIIIENLPAANCTITEEQEDGFLAPHFDTQAEDGNTYEGQYQIPAGGQTVEANCTNAVDRTYGCLQITKKLVNENNVTGIAPAEGFAFTVTLNDYSEDTIEVKVTQVGSEDVTSQIAVTENDVQQKEFTIYLKDGQTATTAVIPVTGYHVREQEYANFATAWSGEVHGVLGGGTRDYPTVTALTCTNTYGVNSGSLRVTKEVKAESTTDTVPDDTYHIQVKLYKLNESQSQQQAQEETEKPELLPGYVPLTGNYPYFICNNGETPAENAEPSGYISNNGSIALKKDQYAVIKGIPACYYSITETGVTSENTTNTNYALDKHYTISYEGKTGSILNGQESQAKVINTFKSHLAELTITKAGAQNVDENQSFIFRVQCEEPTHGVPVDMTVVITGNNSVTLTELPVGIYTITEQSGWSWRYTFTSASGKKLMPTTNESTIKVNVDGSANNTVTVTNSRNFIYWLNGAAAKVNIFNGSYN